MTTCDLTPRRGGHSATDPRLGRVPEWDARNNDYPVGPLLLGAAGEVESKQWLVPTLGNQRREGACVGFAFSHELVAHPAAWDFTPPGWRWPWIDGPTWGLERFATSLYHQAQRIDPWPGGEYPGASPAMAGTSLLAGVKVLHRLGYLREYRWATTVDDVTRTVSTLGPVVLGCAWYDSMYEPDRQAWIKPVGRPVGGHALLISGVFPDSEHVVVTNSWGRRWGLNGNARLAFTDLETLLGLQGEVCVPLVRTEPADDA